MVNYPAQIDTSISMPKAVDNHTPVTSSQYNKSRDGIIAIETELGVKPSGIYSTVKARLDAIDTSIAALNIISLAGDLGGTYSIPLVTGLQGNPISIVTPTISYVLAWTGIAWAPTAMSTSISIHNNLLNIQGGETDGYYHLTGSEHTWLTDGYTTSYWTETKGGTGQNTYITGDILYSSASDTLSTLSAGTDGYVLTLSSGLPSWEESATVISAHNDLTSIQGGAVGDYYHSTSTEYTWLIDGPTTTGYWTETKGGTGQNTYTIGDILYSSASDTLSTLSAGTDGYVLTLSSGLPSWNATSSVDGYPSILYKDTTPVFYVSASPSPFGGNTAFCDGYLMFEKNTPIPALFVEPTSTHDGLALQILGQSDYSGTYNGGDINIQTGDGYSAGNLILKMGDSNQGNLIINGSLTTNMQSAKGSVYIKNGSVIPTGNPIDGGYLYVESGSLKYRGSSGTITIVASA